MHREPSLPPSTSAPTKQDRYALLIVLRLALIALLPMLACNAPWSTEDNAQTAAGTESPDTLQPASSSPNSQTDAYLAQTTTFVDLLPEAPDSLNPILTTNPAALQIQNTFLPSLVALDTQSGAPRPALAQTWQWSPDNLTLTMTLRSDLTWSDGRPVTARDAAFTLSALTAPSVQSPWASQYATLAQTTAPQPDLLIIRQSAPDCALLPQLALPLLPSHLFAEDYSDLRSALWNMLPTVGAGAFLPATINPGEIRLLQNPLKLPATPQFQQLIFRFDPDPALRLRAVGDGTAQRAWDVTPQSGESNASQPQPITPLLQPILSNGMSMLVMNMADPATPQPGTTPDGVLNPQAPHPILADLSVRAAIAAGVDWRGLVQSVYGPNAAPQAAWIPPSLGWAHDPTISLPTYNPQSAATLLEQSGWMDTTGDGMRERNGQPLQLVLLTNEDNPQRAALAQAAAAQLNTLGLAIRTELLPFDAAQKAVTEQRYDLAIVGWTQMAPDPAAIDFWHSRGDQPGSGLNLTSYQNPALDALLDEARSLSGCDEAQRAARYRTAQQVIAADLPAIPLTTQVRYQALAPGWSGVPASPWDPYANITSWQPPWP